MGWLLFILPNQREAPAFQGQLTAKLKGDELTRQPDRKLQDTHEANNPKPSRPSSLAAPG